MFLQLSPTVSWSLELEADGVMKNPVEFKMNNVLDSE